MVVPVICSFIRRKDMDVVLNCLVTDAVGPGEYHEKFIKASKEILGFESGVALRSIFDALKLALDALGVPSGSSLLTSVLAPAWYQDFARNYGYTLLFADVAADSPLPTMESLRAAIEKVEQKPLVYLAYSPFGLLPNFNELRELGFFIIEDISTALGASCTAEDGAVFAGDSGDLAIMGLEQGGLITCGGGALLFSKQKRVSTVLANLVQDLSQELRLSDFNAALGFAQCKDYEDTKKKRGDISNILIQALARSKHRALRQHSEGSISLWALPLLIESSVNDVTAYMTKKEIETMLAFKHSIISSMLSKAEQGRAEEIATEFPAAFSLAKRILLCPLHEKIGNEGLTKYSKVLATLP